MTRWQQTAAICVMAGALAATGIEEAAAGWGWRRTAAAPVVVTQRVIVPAPAYYAPAPVATPAYYAPAPVATAAYYAPAYRTPVYSAVPVTGYYAPAAYVAPVPVTTNYGPRRVRTYYAPGVYYVP